MITFGPMTPLVAVPRLRRVLRLAALAGAAWCSAARADAQATLSHTEDAAPIPRGSLRLRVMNAWTRWDQQFGVGGLVSLGDPLSADPLGAAQLPRLTPIQTSLQALAADPALKLSLGRLITRADSRIVTTPVALELGVTRRLSVGVLVPVVETRRTVSVRVNDASGTPANVGLVPAGQARLTAAQLNGAAYQGYQAAAASLGALITACRANPGAGGCAAFNADPAGAQAAQALAARFAAAAQSLGTDSSTAHLAPRAGGVFALEIELQRNALNLLLQRYLGAGTATVGPVFFASTDFSYQDLQGGAGANGLLAGPYGGGIDSIRTTNRIGFGDISVGAQYLLFDHFQRDTLPLAGLQSRLAIGGAVRFATSRADTATNLVDIGTGEGAGVEVHGALDVIRGRVGATVATRYVKSFAREVSAVLYGDPEAAFPLPAFGRRRRTAGDAFALDLTPRYLLSETFALDGHYGLERTGATTYDDALGATADQPAFCAYVSCGAPAGAARTAQQLGVGLRYSTVDAFARGRAPYPVEVSFTHLTTVTGDPGVPKLSRDQIQLRLFYQLFGR